MQAEGSIPKGGYLALEHVERTVRVDQIEHVSYTVDRCGIKDPSPLVCLGWRQTVESQLSVTPRCSV